MIPADLPTETVSYGRYVQREDRGVRTGYWHVRVHSVDKYPDRSMRVNVIIANTTSLSLRVAFKDVGQIQLVSEASSIRVRGYGRPEGAATATQLGSTLFTITPSDSVRVAFRFPAFPDQEEPKVVRFTMLSQAFEPGYNNIPDVTIRDIALFAAK